MLEIAVIGSGAAGLAASRHLIGCGIRPVIFETSHGVGGAWNARLDNDPHAIGMSDASTNPDETTAASTDTPVFKMWDSLSTNLSKHTCRYSDFPWPTDAPTFPSVEDMNTYLQEYASEHIVDPTCFKLGCKVMNVKRSLSSDQSYTVEWKSFVGNDEPAQSDHGNQDAVVGDGGESTERRDFDGVIIATGFFSSINMPDGFNYNDAYHRQPQSPSSSTPADTSTDSHFEGTILHSSQYRSPQPFHDQTVAIVGSSFSAMEIAADIASTAARVIHVVSNVPWVVPRYVPSKDGKLFVPFDLSRFTRDRDAPAVPQHFATDEEACQLRHERMRNLVGTKQAKTALGEPTNTDSPSHLAVSDDYLNWVLGGSIEIVHGRAVRSSSNRTLEVESKNQEGQFIGGLDTIIACTGYRSNVASILDSNILDVLEYDENNADFAPFVSCWDTLHPKLPRFGFCGMYRGPYLGGMDLQGRLVANVFSGSVKLKQDVMEDALQNARKVRDQQPRPQFPNWDYAGYLDTLAQQCQLLDIANRQNGAKKGDFVSPAFYQPDPRLAEEAMVAATADRIGPQMNNNDRDDIYVANPDADNFDGSKELPSIMLRALIGDYQFDRKICHFNANNRKETVSGTIRYSLKSNHDKKYVLYREDGLFHLTPTKALEVFREYEYVATPSGDLEIYFVEGGKRAHLFLRLRFTKQSDDGYWVASSDHLCINDLYQGKFEVLLDGTGLGVKAIVVTYRVKGPEKDYESTTHLTPI